ncbi:hypothetical protein [Bradyrhizobium sp. CCBAU 051011]|uniref:hypothetical protein n=1 Tax=Bradyrhizobium sp. CCBAU 051011 TaxID=858422 RepID=UPI00192A1B7A|nr:hypothetical protein [Bradyrhizobium sp. CCBAU 051011]
MPGSEVLDADGSRQTFHVTYYGDNPDDHSLDVEALAPALLGFDRLVRESNAVLNGDRARVRVLVTSDFEHKCFNINFEVVQQVFEKVKTFFQDDRVKTAKDVLQTIGVIRSAGVGSLLDYLKWKKGNKVEKVEKVEKEATPVEDASGNSTTTPSQHVTIQIIGGEGNTINIHPDVIKLAESSRVLDAVKETFTPIEMNEANRVEFRENDQPVMLIEKSDVREIVLAADTPDAVKESKTEVPANIVATLYVYSPVFDERAKRWRFLYNRDKHIYADISGTSIGADAMKRGGSFVNDRYRVRMEVTPPATDDKEAHYKIIEVLEFTPAPQQGNLALPAPRNVKEPRIAKAPPKKASVKKAKAKKAKAKKAQVKKAQVKKAKAKKVKKQTIT